MSFPFPAVLLFICLCASLFTFSILRFAKSGKRLLDIPDARSSHSRPTPTGGGLAIFLAFELFAGYGYAVQIIDAAGFLALSCAGLAALTGLLDDLSPLRARVKIALQFLTVIIILLLLGGAPAIPVFALHLELGLFGYLVAALAFVWFINLFNFMDGIDGLAALETIFVCLGASLLAWSAGSAENNYLLLGLAAAVAGFLPFNLPPAKIFMGDAGSNFLGCALGAIGLLAISDGILNLWCWSILLGIFIVDATYVLLARMGLGEVWYDAHRSHAYQLAARRLSSHGRVLMLVALLNCCWLLPLAWLAMGNEEWGLLLTLLAYAPLAVIVRLLRAGRAKGA